MSMPAEKQYTVRGVPLEVDAHLRRLASIRNVSLNQVIVDELTRATIGNPQRADFTDLVGMWPAEDPEFDEILASQRHIDAEMWK